MNANPHAGNGASPAASSAAEAFSAQRLSDISMPARQAVVQGIGFDEGSVAAIVGLPNAGKTALTISMVLHIGARAERWLNLKVAGGPVLYFAAEAPASVVMRAKAAAARLGFSGASLYVSTAVPALGGEFSGAYDAERIISTIRAVETEEGEAVRLVGLDTLAACLADGDENGEGMLRLVEGAKRIALETGACVVLVHHPNKADAASLRGHGSLAAACDSILRIDVEDITGVRCATLVKARDHATGLQLRFELEQVILEERDSFGDPRSTIIVRASNTPAPRPKPRGKRQQELLAELERRYRTGERQWDEAAIREAGRTLGMRKSSAQDALRGLTLAGYVVGSAASLTLKYPPADSAP